METKVQEITHCYLLQTTERSQEWHSTLSTAVYLFPLSPHTPHYWLS